MQQNRPIINLKIIFLSVIYNNTWKFVLFWHFMSFYSFIIVFSWIFENMVLWKPPKDYEESQFRKPLENYEKTMNCQKSTNFQLMWMLRALCLEMNTRFLNWSRKRNINQRGTIFLLVTQKTKQIPDVENKRKNWSFNALCECCAVQQRGWC